MRILILEGVLFVGRLLLGGGGIGSSPRSRSGLDKQNPAHHQHRGGRKSRGDRLHRAGVRHSGAGDVGRMSLPARRHSANPEGGWLAKIHIEPVPMNKPLVIFLPGKARHLGFDSRLDARAIILRERQLVELLRDFLQKKARWAASSMALSIMPPR